jgi:site-specific recombinase XerD
MARGTPVRGARVDSRGGGSAGAAPRDARLFRLFLEHLRALGRSPGTLAAYEDDRDRWIEWRARDGRGPFDLRGLSGADVARFVRESLDAGIPPATVNRRLASLKSWADFAFDRRVLPGPAHAAVRAVPYAALDAAEPRALSARDERALVEEVESRGSAMDRALVYLLLRGGFRARDLAHVPVGALATEPGGRRAWLCVAPGSRVAVPGAARRPLLAYLRERDAGPGEPLFLGRRGPLSEDGISEVVGKYAAFAGVDAGPRVLRRAWRAAAAHDASRRGGRG